jgi:hypothetical protein
MLKLSARKSRLIRALFLPAIGFLLIMALRSSTWLPGNHRLAEQSLQRSPGAKHPILIEDKAAARLSSMAVPFTPNAGRFPEQVKFQAPLPSGSFYLTEDSLFYSFLKKEKPELKKGVDHGNAELIAFREILVDEKGRPVRLKPAGEKKSLTRVSYFRGNDPSGWKTGLTTYNTVSLGEICPGVELKVRASARNVEKVFHLAPGASPENIRIKVEGVKYITAGPGGRLALETGEGRIFMGRPAAFQEADGQRSEVDVEYAVYEGNTYGFRADAYDETLPLVIDPAIDTLLASTFLGGSGQEDYVSAAIGQLGNIYVAGHTQSVDFPLTAGVRHLSSNVAPAVFTACLSNDLRTLQSAAFLEGGICDVIRLAETGDVYVGGWVTSADFPVTPGAYDTSFNVFKAFISRLDPSLTVLLASTYLGGSSLSSQSVNCIALDPSGSVYVAGATGSADFPITPGAFQTAFTGSQEGFVSKLDPNLSTLLASTLLGGYGGDYVNALALDGSSNIYAAGRTESANFPITPGAFRTERIGTEAFVSRLTGDLSTLLASTFIGGSENDYGTDMTLDSSGNVYVAGYTGSKDFPVSSTAFKKRFKDESISETDGFISILSGDLAGLVASTLLGGSRNDDYLKITIDGNGRVYATGDTSSPDFPVTWGSYDLDYNGGVVDIFISMLDPTLSVLEASTFLGGSDAGGAGSISLDDRGDIIIAGSTRSSDFPLTPEAFDTTFSGGSEGFISKLSINRNMIDVDVTVDTSPSGFAMSIDGVSFTSPQTFRWTEGTEHAIGVTSPQGESPAGLKRIPARIPASRRLKIPVIEKRGSFGQDPDAGTRYAFSSWSDGGSQSHAITVRSSTWQYTAFFDKQHTLTTSVNPPEGGTATPAGTNWIKEGTTVQVTATPNPGYRFSSWSGDIISGSSSISVTIDNPKSLTANFVPIIQYALTTSSNPPEGGTVTPTGTNLFEKGTVVKVTAVPNPDYAFLAWSGDNLTRARVISITMDGPKTLVANFIQKTAYPPLNVRLQRLENDMIFYKEYVNRLTWQPNGQNAIKVLQYRIYCKPKGSADDSYRLLAEVFFSTLQYDHRGLRKDDLYTYRITSLNIYGQESAYVEVGN